MTPDQIANLRKLAAKRKVWVGWTDDLNALIDDWEERGREVERLRAELSEYTRRTIVAEAEIERLKRELDGANIGMQIREKALERADERADERVSLAGWQALDVFRAGYSTSTYYPPQFNAALDTLAKESAALRAEIERLEKNATELRAEIERLRAELEVEEAYNRVIGDLVRQRDDAEAKLARVLKRAGVSPAPCDVCGYNGPGYFQSDSHPCIALAAAQPKESR